MQEVIIILFHILCVWNLFIDTVVCVLSSAEFDQLISVLCQTSTLRDVIAFLKSFYGKDLAGSPFQLSDEDICRAPAGALQISRHPSTFLEMFL